MKKLICTLLSAIMLVAIPLSVTGCGTPREELLKLYMPGEYIDEEIFEEFESWYETETGNKVTVQLETFETVENIQRAVEGSKADYDLLCPSDYMIEYLISKELLIAVDKNIIDISADGFMKEQYIDSTKEFDPELKYSVPYMYGTLGLVYDITKTNKHLTSWEDFFGNEFKNHRSIKKSMREAYAAACIYNARNDADSVASLSGDAQKQKIQSIFEDTRAEIIESAKNILNAAKSGAVWDIDNVKFEMAAGTSDVAVALMWSCDAGYVMNTYEDDEGEEKEGNRNLWYVVPEEGGNVYIDAFVISKYAKNVTAANYFLKFLCTKDIAVKNSEYAGCISPVTAAYDELEAYYEDDEDGIFEETPAGWKEMFMETMFPSEETLNRCGVMKDFKNGNSAVVQMWGNIVA